MLNEMTETELFMLEMDKGRKANVFEKAWLTISVLYKRMARSLKETAAVVSGKKLADNKIYEGASRVSQEDVEMNPRRWIIEECVPACEILWSKNIYTFMCSDGLDRNAWIELEIECLSPENKGILEQIKREYHCYQYHEGCINIPVEGKGAKAQAELIKIAERFVIQDVPTKYAAYTMDTIYKRCGCFKDIDNPDYVPIEEQLANMTFENWGLDIQEPTIRVVDPEKIVKSDEEYIDEVGAIKDSNTGLIYRNQFHYEKHLRYVDSLNAKKGLK